MDTTDRRNLIRLRAERLAKDKRRQRVLQAPAIKLPADKSDRLERKVTK